MNTLLRTGIAIIVGILLWIAGVYYLNVVLGMDGRSILGGFSLGMGCMFIIDLIGD